MERVTYILLTYNHEKYIAEAVKCALSQTYDALDIIISDDASSDKTFALIKQLTQDYSGPHKLLVRRNAVNMGLVPHLNSLLGMSNTSLQILSAGDDLSDPCKAERIYSVWKSTGALVFGCNPVVIDDQGVLCGRFYQSDVPEIITAHYMIETGNASLFISGIDKSVFEQWGDLPPTIEYEDQLIPFRAALLKKNGVVVIDEPLVQYRHHSESLTEASEIKGAFRFWGNQFVAKFNCYIERYEAWLSDIRRCESLPGLGCSGLTEELSGMAENRILFFTGLKFFINEKSFITRMKKTTEILSFGTFSFSQVFVSMLFSLTPGLAIWITRLMFKLGLIGNVGKRGIRKPLVRLN